MNKILRIVFFGVVLLSFNHAAFSQVVLSGTSYTETFDGIGTALPTGWSVKTAATSSGLGTAATYNIAQAAWNNTGGGFKNYASADGLISSSIPTAQNGSGDRSLGVKQTGTAGANLDPGAAFVLQLSNTTGLTGFSMTFKLQSLDISGTTTRLTTWVVDYGIGSSPTTFTPVSTSPTPLTTGNVTFTNTSITVNFGTALDEIASNVWIRVGALAGSQNGGSRASTGIDDVSLTYTPITTVPNFTSTFPKIQNATSSGFDIISNLDKVGTTYYVVLPDNAAAPSSAQVKVGTDASDGAAAKAGSIAGTSANTNFPATLSGLASATDYDVYFVAENAIGLQAAPVKVDITTLDLADVIPPNFTSGYPKIQNTTYSTFQLATNLDEGGKTYYVVLGGGASAPTSDQVKAGKDAAGNTLTSPLFGSMTILSSATEYIANITGLNGSTSYDVYFAAEDNIPNLQTNPTLVSVSTPQGPFVENFNTCSGNVSSFSQYNVTGVDIWNCTTFGNNTTNGVQVNGGFSGGSRQNEDWLITPILALGISPILTFDNLKEFSGPDVVLKISTNYDGTSAPSSATWTDVSYTKSTGTWVSSGSIDLSTYNSQNAFIAFVYTSGTTANSGARWSIDNFSITNTTASYITTSVTQIPGFGFVVAPSISTSKSYTVTGTGLTQDVTVTAPTNFEVSKDNSSFSSSFSFTVAELATPQTVYVRFHPSAGVGVVTSNIVHTSGTVSKNVTVSGTEGVNPRDNTFDIVSWNIEWFSITNDVFTPSQGVGPGASGPRTPTQVTTQKDNVKAAILAMDADVYGLLEVGNENHVFELLVNELRASGYSGFRSPDPVVPSGSYGNDSSKVQRLGFIYKTSIVSNIKRRVMFETMTLNTTTLPGYPDADPTRFWASGRFPYVVTADVSLNGVTKKIDFVVVHPRANGAENSTNQRYAMRKYDVEAMKDSLDANYANHNFIVMGDYNDDVDFTVASAFVPTTVSSFQKYVDDPTHYTILTKTLSNQGLSSFINPPSTDMIDHISVSDELQPSYAANSVALVDLRSSPYSISNYVNTTSDHLPVTVSFNLVKDPQTISFNLNTNATKTVGDPTFNLTATSTSGLAVTYTSSNPNVATVSGNTVTIVGAGTTDIKASQAGNSSYSAGADVTQTLTVNSAALISQTITFSLGTDATKTFGASTFTLSATATSSLSVTFTSSNLNVATVSGNVVTIVGAGTSDLKASQAGNSTYAAAPDVTQTLTVNKATPTITWSNPAAITYSATLGSAQLNATATLAGTAVAGTFVYTPAAGAIPDAGTKTLSVNFTPTNAANYNAVNNTQVQIVINKAAQTITFPAITTKTLGDAAFALGATSSSTLAVAYSTTSDKATITGGQVTLVKAGSITINADQAGNTNYNAATQSSQTFCINPAKPTITLSGSNTATPLLTSSSTAGNQWYLNGTAINGATNATYSVTGQGSYTVAVKVDNCQGVPSAAQVIVITGDLAGKGSEDLLVFPNPVKNKLTIRLGGFAPEPVQLIVYDINGKTLDKFSGPGGSDVTLDVGSYATGRYILRAAQSEHIQQQPFVKE